MNKDYQCLKCGNIYKDEQSNKFVKTKLKVCPICGSSEVVLLDTIKVKIKDKVKTKGFVKKTINS